MDGLTLLREARAAGLFVTVEGDELRIRGPRRAHPFARQLIARKAEVLQLLADRAQAEDTDAWVCCGIEMEMGLPVGSVVIDWPKEQLTSVARNVIIITWKPGTNNH